MSTHPLLFPRRAHLRTTAEFQAVFAEGKRISSTCFRLHARLPLAATEIRLGVAVAKRVDKSAVARNRLRRQVKEAFRLQRASLVAGDYVVIAKPGASKVDNAAIRVELLALLERARTLMPIPTPGTMPPVANAARKPTDA
jgi:ribonuclease P protein component